MNRTIMICLAVLLVLGLTACTQAVSKAAAEQSAVPSAADSTEQNVLPESTEPPAPEMIDFEVNRYAVTAGAAAYLGGAEEQYKALVDAVCSKKKRNSIRMKMPQSVRRSSSPDMWLALRTMPGIPVSFLVKSSPKGSQQHRNAPCSAVPLTRLSATASSLFPPAATSSTTHNL